VSVFSRTLGIFSCFLVLFGCSPSTNSPSVNKTVALTEANLQRELAVKEKFGLTQRLFNVAEPIMLANVDLCGKLVTNYTGAEFVTLESTGKDFRDVSRKLYGLEEQPTVLLMGATAPALDVLQAGDVITKVNGKQVPKGNRGVVFVHKTLAKQKSSAAAMRIKRAGATLDVTVPTKRACNSPVKVLNSNAVNAVADGKSIGVTRGMMRFAASDKELATIVGHELAHNSRRHIQAKQANAVLGAVVGVAISVAVGVDVTKLGTQVGAAAHSHGFETEADYVGLYHAARAGYDISDAPNLWRRMAASNPGSIGFRNGTHPSSAKRFLTLDATVQEIFGKQEAELPLIPEEKKAKALSQQKETS